jgi:hypothetical protein
MGAAIPGSERGRPPAGRTEPGQGVRCVLPENVNGPKRGRDNPGQRRVPGYCGPAMLAGSRLAARLVAVSVAPPPAVGAPLSNQP